MIARLATFPECRCIFLQTPLRLHALHYAIPIKVSIIASFYAQYISLVRCHLDECKPTPLKASAQFSPRPLPVNYSFVYFVLLRYQCKDFCR